MESIRAVLKERDQMSDDEITCLLDEARDAISEGEDPEDVLLDFFGLEPDYLFDLELMPL